MNRRFEPGWYPKTSPREVEGGIRAKSARGAIASTWWSTRFIEVLEQMGMGARLARGRNYARRGQVISLDVSAGVVTAKVQGSRARPYSVRIGVVAYGKAEWARVESRLADDAWFVAKLLSGEMPPDIEDVFRDAELALFPTSSSDLSLDCSCPDWEVPCKHLAAVCYLIAERFDADPFEVLAWRGRGRDELLSRLGSNTSDDSGDAAVVPLHEQLDDFYVSKGESTRVRSATASGASLLDQLPPVTVTVRKRPLAEVLRPAYAAMTAPPRPAVADASTDP